MDLNPDEFLVETYQPAEQKKRWSWTPDRGVHVTHVKTRIDASCHEHTSRHANLSTALRELERKLHEHAVLEANKPRPAGLLPAPQAKGMINEFFKRVRCRRTACHGSEAPGVVLHEILNKLYTQAFMEGARSEVSRPGIPAVDNAARAAERIGDHAQRTSYEWQTRR